MNKTNEALNIFGKSSGKIMWDKLFKNGPSEICGRHPLKSRPYPFKFFKDCLPQILFVPFLTVC